MSQSLWSRAIAPYRALDRQIWVLAAARSVNTMGFSMVMPFMAMYLVEQRGASGATYGLIYLIAGLSAALSQAVAGEAADRFTRRQVMVTALSLRSLNMLFLGLAVLEEWPIPVLVAMMVVNAILRAAFEPAAAAAVTDLAPADARVTAFGLQRIGINLGWALGPALGGAFSASYALLFFVAAPITLLAAFAAATVGASAKVESRSIRPPRDATHALSMESIKKLWSENRPFALYLFLVLGGAVMTTQIFSTMSVFARTELGVPRAEIGLLYTLNGVLVVLFQAPAVALIERLELKRVLVLGPMVYAASYAIMGFAAGFATLAVAVGLLTAGEVLFAALSDVAAYLGDPKRLGRAFGLFGLMQSFGISLGPMVGGSIYDGLRHQHQTMWAVIAAGSAMLSVGYFAFVRSHGVEAIGGQRQVDA